MKNSNLTDQKGRPWLCIFCLTLLWGTLFLAIGSAEDIGDPDVNIEGALLIEADNGLPAADTTDNGLSVQYFNFESAVPPPNPTVQFLVNEDDADWIWAMNGDTSAIPQMNLSQDSVLNLYDPTTGISTISLNPLTKTITIGGYPVLTGEAGEVISGLNELTVQSSDSATTLLQAKGDAVDVDGRLRVKGVDVLTYLDYVGQDENLIFNSDLAQEDIVNFYEEGGAPLTKIQRINNGQVDPVFDGFGANFPEAGNVHSAIRVESNTRETIRLEQDILVNPSKRYRISGYVRCENLPAANAGSTTYFAMECYDRDDNKISVFHVKYAPESLATLTHPYDPTTDTSIYINEDWGSDASGWSTYGSTDYRGLLVWGYQDYRHVAGQGSYSRYSQGSSNQTHTWLWDTPNVVHHTSGPYAGSYEVPLQNVYAGRFGSQIFPVGTEVSASATGANSIYAGGEKILDTGWRKFEGIVGGGISEPNVVLTDSRKFLPGTKHIKLSILHNWGQKTGSGGPVRTYLAGFSFEPLDDEITELNENVTFKKDVAVIGDVAFGRELTVGGKTTIHDDLEVTQQATVQDLTVNGNVTLTTVQGDITAGAFTVPQ